MSEQTRFIEEMVAHGWQGRFTRWGVCTGFVYVIFTRGAGHMKIGFTKSDPRLRLANLQTGNHLHLRLASFFPGCSALERAIHADLAVYRTSGEWFERTPEANEILERFIEQAWGDSE